MALAAHDQSSAEIRQKRLSIELESLKTLPAEYKFNEFDTPLGKYIRFQIERKAIKEDIKVDPRVDKFVFDVLLDHKYPFTQPQIFCRTAYCKPPLNDGRDLFADILRSEWRIAKKIVDIIQYIPVFIPEIENPEEDMKVFGTFHLGYLYEMSNWGTNGMNRDSRVFNCEEQDEYDEETYYPRYLVITQSAFLLLEPNQKAKNMGMLLAWATLQSLDKLRRNLSRPELVTFVWRQVEGKQPWVLNLLINKHEECISTLVSNMQTMGVGVEKNTKTQSKIREFEVTKDAIARMDIEQILEHIAAYESTLENDLSLSTVQTLNTLYQKAVEYYSAFDDLLYNDFLHKSQELFQRPDIQAVLNSQEVAQSPRVQKTKIDFDMEEEKVEEVEQKGDQKQAKKFDNEEKVEEKAEVKQIQEESKELNKASKDESKEEKEYDKQSKEEVEAKKEEVKQEVIEEPESEKKQVFMIGSEDEEQHEEQEVYEDSSNEESSPEKEKHEQEEEKEAEDIKEVESKEEKVEEQKDETNNTEMIEDNQVKKAVDELKTDKEDIESKVESNIDNEEKVDKQVE